MTDPLVDYQNLGHWTDRLPAACANRDTPHRLTEGAMLSGWAECSCGGHRTVQCLAWEDGRTCRAMHFLPALTTTCTLARIPLPRPPHSG